MGKQRICRSEKMVTLIWEVMENLPASLQYISQLKFSLTLPAAKMKEFNFPQLLPTDLGSECQQWNKRVFSSGFGCISR